LTDPALPALARALRAEAVAANQRRALVLSGPADWTLASARAALSPGPSVNGPTAQGRTVWLSNRKLVGPHLPVTAGGRLLGSELDTLVYDAHGGLDLDGLGGALGALRGGGLLVLITPDLEAWPLLPDPLLAAPAGASSTAALRPNRTIRRLIRILGEAPGVTMIQAGQPLPLPTPELRDAAPRQPADQGTPDQARAVEAILKVARGRARRPLVLSSDRGRGKSSALGLAAVQLLAGSPVQILVTAPRHAAVAPVFAHAGRLLPQARTAPGTMELDGASLRYLAPDHLAQTRPPADLLLVDEAAGIPAPLLETLLRHYPRIVFATTVHGYEGTGRGFEVRFRRTLDRLTPAWRALTLTTPIRWSELDPIEALAASALLLDATPAADADLAGATPANCIFERLDRDALATDESRLRQLFGLLVLAHYQTRPADLRHLLDGPDLHLYTLAHGGQIVAVALGAIEGGLDPALGAAVFAGRRRPRGHLLPQTLSAHAGLDAATGLRYLRLIRIAVHPAAQGRGLGQALVAAVRTEAQALGCDLVGASFGATAALLRFWRHCGMPAAHLGTSRNAASGAQAAVVLAGLSPAGIALAELASHRLAERLPVLLAGPFQALEPDIALALIGSPAEPDPVGLQVPVLDLDLPVWRELLAFAHAARPFESVIAPLNTLVSMSLNHVGAILPEIHAWALLAAVLQHRGLHAVAGLIGLSGRADVIATLRAAARTLLNDLAPAELTSYVRTLRNGVEATPD
jgi:tRNA(Met) cytidine acetyltransferase